MGELEERLFNKYLLDQNEHVYPFEIKEAVEEMLHEFPKSEIRHVGAYGEYNEEYYPFEEVNKWIVKWLRK